MDAGVKVEGLRQSSSKYSVLHLFTPIYIIRYKERFLAGGSLPPLAPSSFDVEGTIPASHTFLVSYSSSSSNFFFLFLFFRGINLDNKYSRMAIEVAGAISV